MCVINAAIVVFLIAESRGERAELATRVRHAAMETEDGVDANSSISPSQSEGCAEACREQCGEQTCICSGGVEHDSHAADTASEAACHRTGPRAAPTVLRSFAELLDFWGNVYETHSSERRFLEFSSGIPFSRWLSVVRKLKEDFKDDAAPDTSGSHMPTRRRRTGQPQKPPVSVCACDECS